MTSSDNRLVVVVFYAQWVGTYEMMNGFLKTIEGQLPDIEIYRVDVEENQALATKMRISTVPTTLLFRNHEVVDMIEGAVSRKKLLKKFSPYL